MTLTRIKPLRIKSMLGMSLVEILAAMLIGLIGMTIIMQVFALSESRKRTTGGTSDAQITGTVATFTLEREMRNAGYGIVSSDSNLLDCDTVVAFDTRRTPSDFTFSMAPFIIVDGAGGAPDQVTVTYSNEPIAAPNAGNLVSVPSSFPSAWSMADTAGLDVGDLAIVYEPTPGVDCGLIEITNLPGGNNVQHTPGYTYTYTDEYGFPVTQTATYNKNGGLSLGGGLTIQSQVFSLGRQPKNITYMVNGARMETRTLFPYDPAFDLDNDGLVEAEIADGVIQLQAQYGKDTNADRIVDTWDNVTPATSADWLQVQAARFAVLVRSSQFERDPVTTVAPTWYGGAFTMTNLDGTPDSNPGDANDWRHYRYRTYQTVVPLRNMIWSTDP